MASQVKSSNKSSNKSAVFGTFGINYDSSENERIRDDGFVALGLVPDCRVFIYGVEVTKDVSEVSVQNNIWGNTCRISLQNPRGRYEISKQDLMGKWREDKDILAAYTYDQYLRPDPRMWDSLMDKISTAAFGKSGAKKIQTGLNVAKKIQGLLGNPYGIPSVKGVTRQIFEVKHASGLTKRSGDIVFDYRDPVYVFFKGRFAPLWYFGFSGIVSGWDDSDVYDSSQVLQIQCEDVLALWKKAKFTKSGAFFPFARAEDRMRSTSKKSATQIADVSVINSFSDLIKIAAFTLDYGKFAYNCHASKPGRYFGSTKSMTFEGAKNPIANMGDSAVYKEFINTLKKDAWIDRAGSMEFDFTGDDSGKYMFTRAPAELGLSAGMSSSLGKLGTGKSSLVDISNIGYIFHGLFGSKSYSLNDSKFSPSNSLFLQFNEIEFPESVPFNGSNLSAYLNLSIRYWEAMHSISKNETVTGWKDNKFFGIAGPHPALTWDFVSNFNILNNIWEQCYIGKNKLASLVMSPNDKIRSTVAGEPTELASKDGLAQATTGISGTAFNFFRPRLFLILPMRFSDRIKSASGGTFGKLGEIFKESSTTVFQYFSEKIKALEYVMYASPLGDIYIEPELYDFHPLEFSKNIDTTNIIKKKEVISIRTQSGLTDVTKGRKDKAYMFDTNANHPFFIMEKDRIRTTQTFKHSLIHTAVEVQGGMNPQGGVLELLTDKLASATTAIGLKQRSQGIIGANVFVYGTYVADGYQKMLDPGSVANKVYSELTELTKIYNKTVMFLFLQEDYTTSFQILAQRFYDIMVNKKYGSHFDGLLERFDTIEAKYLTSPPAHIAHNIFYELFVNLKEASIANSNMATFFAKDLELNQKNASASLYASQEVAIKNVISKFVPGSIDTYIDLISNADIMLRGTNLESKEAVSLINLYGPIACEADVKLNTIMQKLYAIEVEYKKYNEAPGVLTLADEKLAEKQGRYDPSMDMVKHYGYNPKSPIKNTYIKNGPEAYQYARTVFNRLKGEAFELNVSLIGRPEFMLNRPYYCERKDAIGLLKNYSITYQFSGDFNSTAKLNYVRKNAITYAYSLGNLHPLIGTKDNSFFKQQANLFYKMNNITSSLTGKIATNIGNAVAGESPGTGRKMAGRLVGGITNNVLNSFFPLGGIYIAHDRIGHIPFDTRFGETLDDKATSTIADIVTKGMEAELEKLYLWSKEVKSLLETRKQSMDMLIQLNNMLDPYYKQISDTQTEIVIARDAADAPGTLPEQKALYIAGIENLNNRIKSYNDFIIAINDDIQREEAGISGINKSLYGVSHKEKPKDITKFIKDSYELTALTGSKPSLYGSLMQLHSNVFNISFSLLEIREDAPVSKIFGSYGTADYYIFRMGA